MIKPGQAGLRTYALRVVDALALRADVDAVVLVGAGNADTWSANTVRTKMDFGDPTRRLLWRRRNIPQLVRSLDVDALFVPAPEPVSVRDVPVGMVVHDIGPILAPAFYGRLRQARYLATMGHSLRSADAVFTVSESTRVDLVRWFGEVSLRAQVAGPRLVKGKRLGESQPVKTSGGYALYVGSMLPHKNVATIVSAFESGYGDSFAGLPDMLYIVGPEYGSEVRDVLSGAEKRVRHLGFVSDDRLAELYSGAKFLLFPSLFEGFGLPLVEALEKNIPCIASDLPVFREVAGDAVSAYVERILDPEAWRAAMRAVDGPGYMSCELTWDSCAEVVVSRFMELSH